ncbi:MAG: DSD1 family PLP-dependent enzyme [Deltaproteobacteria bacterium]|nr:DSD1 family PLP-dependent enzyme [Deltaproteobacteria bacterium]
MGQQKDYRGISKWNLDTPCLVVAEEVLEQNIQAMKEHLASFGKQLRPHAKTHKCSQIAKKQMASGCAGICVAKVGEAEGLIAGEVKKILITSPVVTDQKIARLLDCLAVAPELIVVVDNDDNARKLNEAAKSRGLRLNVLVDLDPGNGRTGVRFQDGMALGRLVAGLPSLRLRGIQCYAGQVQHLLSFEERTRTSMGWMNQAAAVVREFRKQGLPCDVFTGSGTGTSEIDCRVPELTDLQTGSYTLMDAEYINIGSSQDPARFTKFPPALTLLTTVICTNQANCVTVDAGLKALYHHGGTPFVLNPADAGLQYDWWGDEQGKITFSDPAKKPKLGQVLELVVSHCDPTVNLFDQFYVTRKGLVTDVWPIDLRGRCQ